MRSLLDRRQRYSWRLATRVARVTRGSTTTQLTEVARPRRCVRSSTCQRPQWSPRWLKALVTGSWVDPPVAKTAKVELATGQSRRSVEMLI
jgi:hypothetical protein